MRGPCFFLIFSRSAGWIKSKTDLPSISSRVNTTGRKDEVIDINDPASYMDQHPIGHIGNQLPVSLLAFLQRPVDGRATPACVFVPGFSTVSVSRLPRPQPAWRHACLSLTLHVACKRHYITSLINWPDPGTACSPRALNTASCFHNLRSTPALFIRLCSVWRPLGRTRERCFGPRFR